MSSSPSGARAPSSPWCGLPGAGATSRPRGTASTGGIWSVRRSPWGRRFRAIPRIRRGHCGGGRACWPSATCCVSARKTHGGRVSEGRCRADVRRGCAKKMVTQLRRWDPKCGAGKKRGGMRERRYPKYFPAKRERGGFTRAYLGTASSPTGRAIVTILPRSAPGTREHRR